jgi:hypothetical protein
MLCLLLAVLAACCWLCSLLAVLAACCLRCLALVLSCSAQRIKTKRRRSQWLAKERVVLQRESCATKIAELCYKDSEDSAGEQGAASATKGTPLERHPLNLNPKR